MPRKEKAKGIHTSPEKSGVKNMTNITMSEDTDGYLPIIMGMVENGKKVNKQYKGLWTEEAFNQCVDEYFEYCTSKNFQPSKPSLQLWLGTNRAMYNEWERFPEKYSYKFDKIQSANLIMESTLQSEIKKYPTGSIFLLKASHGIQDTTKVEVTSFQSSKEETEEIISKLGLDK